MAVDRDLELLDDYLSNRMTGQERTAFEQRLATEADLAQMAPIQQAVINNLRQARHAELKTMLQAVPVPPATGLTQTFKVAAGLVGMGTVATLIYFLASQNEPAITPAHVGTAKKDAVKIETPSTDRLPTADSIAAPTDSAATEEKVATTIAPRQRNRSERNGKPVIHAFVPTQEEQADNTEPDELSLPDAGSPQNTNSKSAIVAEISNSDKRYNFHYTLVHNKLTLYGNFERDLYEIIEVFDNDKRTAFLYYKNNYYLLNDGANSITPLVVIHDSILTGKLDKYRTQE